MKKTFIYQVPVTFETKGTVSIIAESKEEAYKIANNDFYIAGDPIIPTSVEANKLFNDWDIPYFTKEIGTPSARVCTHCNKGMNEGYLLEESSETFCSEKCFQKEHTDDYQNYIRGEEIYWTNWEPEACITND